jgi:hypothetical protein
MPPHRKNGGYVPCLSIYPSFLSSRELTWLQDWCVSQAFEDAETVSERKLCSFLETEVIGRESRAQAYVARRKRKLEEVDAIDEGPSKETVGFSVIESYVNGVTELWKEQRLGNNNPHVLLRGKELGDLLETAKRADRDRRRAEVDVDRALSAIIDAVGYDAPEMMEGISWCWREGSQARNGPEPYLRTAADFLIGQYFHRSSDEFNSI